MKRSIRSKFALLLIVTTVILSILLILISSIVLRRVIDEMYENKAKETASVISAVLDPDEVDWLNSAVMDIYNKSEEKILSSEWGSDAFNAYVGQFEEIYDTPEYKSVLEDMRKIQDNSNVDCVYLMSTDFSSEIPYFIYIVDADNAEPCPIGTLDSYEWGGEMAEKLKLHPEKGYDPYITKTEEYGWIVSTFVPVYNSSGNIITYARADISMDTIRNYQNAYSATLAIIALVIMLITCFISINVITSNIVIPAKKLSATAENYWASGESGIRNDFMNLDIKTNDEIEILANSMKKMESDINDYFVTLDATKQELTSVREESEVMKELAYMDALTGIRNKTAYDREIAKLEQDIKSGELKSYGIAMVDLNYLKKINDTYGHDKGNIAIKKVCKLVCDVFVHSPVFRIGGDEFAVILKNHGLNTIDELTETFRKRIAKERNDSSKEYWERISAAIGYAIYDPARDENAENVFRRADEEMYKDKQKQKAERRD